MAQTIRKMLGYGGVFFPFAVAFLIFSTEVYVPWIGKGILQELGSALLIIGVIHLVCAFLAHLFKTYAFFAIVRYTYLLLFLYFIVITGGVQSPLIFLLYLPVVAPALRLEAKATRNTGIVSTLAFASLILFIPTVTIVVLIKFLVQTVLLGTVSYALYGIVSEALHQKIEHEKADRKVSEMIELDHLKSDFLSIAEHQLRTPLSGVRWALEMLKADKSLSIDSLSLVEQSLARINDSLGIVNQMLKTVEDGNALALKIEPIDLPGMIQNIIAELNFVIVKKGVKLTFIQPEPIFIPGDRDKLKAALLNIVDNAIKYSPKATVDISIAQNEREVILSVKDTGIGIPEEDQPYLFARMHRAKNALMLEPDESGVGLSISRKIFELHGGTISIDSTEGKGTIVTVTLRKKIENNS